MTIRTLLKQLKLLHGAESFTEQLKRAQLHKNSPNFMEHKMKLLSS